jgi:hypothetical protein
MIRDVLSKIILLKLAVSPIEPSGYITIQNRKFWNLTKNQRYGIVPKKN